MQLEQEYEEKQMVIHEKHDLEGLIATLCDQVGNNDTTRTQYSLSNFFQPVESSSDRLKLSRHTAIVSDETENSYGAKLWQNLWYPVLAF